MQLNDLLKICLLALESRYPYGLVDINEAILGPQSVPAEGWVPSELIVFFERTAPDILYAPAYLVITDQEAAIYLCDRHEDTPAFWVHCHGKMPPRHPHSPEKKSPLFRPGQSSTPLLHP